MRYLYKALFCISALGTFNACGDNIHPLPPDARPLPPGPEWMDPAPQLEVEPGEPQDPQDTTTPPPPTRDAGMEPDASTAACDSHYDLNGHLHKCQHDQDLPVNGN